MGVGRFKAMVRTLRVRLVIWITVAVFLMVGLTMLIVHEVVRNTLFFEYDQILLSDAKDISLALRHFPDQEVMRTLNRKAYDHVQQGWFVEIYDEKGKRLWASETTPEKLMAIGPALHDLAENHQLKDYFEDGPYRMLVFRPALDGEVTSFSQRYWIRVGSSKQTVWEDVTLLNRVMTLATLLILLVAPLGAYILAGRATRPLVWIISTTARLQPQKLDERLPIRGTDDELDQLSKTINGMLDRIASHIKRQQEFIADAAHELRSPLTAIRSSVEVALNRPRSSEEYQALLADVIDESTRMASLVNRLLLLAEGDAGRLPGRDQAVRLDKLVRESVDMFQAVAESRGIDLKIVALDAALVPGDDFHLRQVIRNLIDNAVKFGSNLDQVPTGNGHDPELQPPAVPVPETNGSRTTQGHVQVEVRIDALKKEAMLMVADTGRGISPQDLPRIFDRFFRGDKSRNRQDVSSGYGLGLSICQTIVLSLGGQISVTSKEGKGSQFKVLLPLISGDL